MHISIIITTVTISDGSIAIVIVIVHVFLIWKHLLAVPVTMPDEVHNRFVQVDRFNSHP